jgi:hypothetical protein
MNKDVTKPFDRFWSILKPDSKDIRDIYLFAIVGGILSRFAPRYSGDHQFYSGG